MAPPKKPGLATLPPADSCDALKDETLGGQAEGFRGDITRHAPRSTDSRGALVTGQPTVATGATMSSLQIAELLGCRHDNVKRTIDSLAARGTIIRPQSEDEPQSDALVRSRPVMVYLLDKRSSYVVVAQLSPEFTGALVDRWQHLEAQVEKSRQLAVPTNFREALLLAADQQEVIERQAVALALAEPKAGALDRIATATDDAVCLREAAKLAQVPERQFIEFLRVERWIFKPRGGRKWMGYADKEAAGLLELKRVPFTRPDGTEGSNVQVLLTPLGQARAAELIERKAPHLRKTKAATDGHQVQLALLASADDELAGSES